MTTYLRDTSHVDGGGRQVIVHQTMTVKKLQAAGDISCDFMKTDFIQLMYTVGQEVLQRTIRVVRPTQDAETHR